MDILDSPTGALDDVRERLTGQVSGPLRLSYVPGPGDVLGTHDYWTSGRHDPRVPLISYSTMFYELVGRLGAKAQILTPMLDSSSVDRGDVVFTRIAPKSTRGRLGYQFDQMQRVAEISDRLDDFDPHVVIASSDMPFRGWQRVGRRRPLILSMHNTFWPMGRPPATLRERAGTALLARQAQALAGAVCTSDECARQLLAVTRKPIPCVVEHPQAVSLPDDPPRPRARALLYLGRIEVTKGVFMLLDAYCGIRDRHPDITLAFAGDGGAATELSARIAATGDTSIRFLGRLDAEGVHDRLSRSDLLICPTTSGFREGLALVGFEAAAHGIPTLASSVVPAIDLLGPAAAVFAADDTAALTTALGTLLADDAVFTRHAEATLSVRTDLLDRSRSWGSALLEVLTRL